MKQMLSMLLAVLLLTGCAGASGLSGSGGGDSSGLCDLQPGEDPAFLSYALAQPVYPDFPQQPQLPGEAGVSQEWDAYQEAYDKYIDALLALRGEEPGLTEEAHGALTDFAARSTPLVLAGQEGKNAVYSPLSLWSALAMLAQCADGDSRRQVLDALGVEGVEALQDQVSRIWRTLYTDDGLSALLLGSSIWLNSAAQGIYVQDTLDLLAQQYFAGVYSIPMGSGEADQAVNDWVREQTRGLIGGDSPVVHTQAEDLALLASSLYYKAAWQEEFTPEQTQTDTFTGADGQEAQVNFMHKTEYGGFIRREGFQAARLATYLGEMVFVLPDQGTTPESLLSEPDFLASLEFYGDAVRFGEVQWSVPKFDADSSLDLKGALAGLGVTDLLDPDKADLSALTEVAAYLSEATQLARVKVDEEGVEAAAVTMFDMALSAVSPRDLEVCVMDLDRPFLFVVRTQDVPLFIGIVNQM